MHIAWAKGGEAKILAIDAQAVRLWSTVPSPPGSRLEGTLLSEPREAVRIKVHACRLQGAEGTGAGVGYLLDGRPLNLGKELRERLVKLASG